MQEESRPYRSLESLETEKKPDVQVTQLMQKIEETKLARLSIWKKRNSQKNAPHVVVRSTFSGSEKQTETTDTVTNISSSQREAEYTLLQNAETEFPAIGSIQLSHIPAEVFSRPDSPISLKKAQNLLSEFGQRTIKELLAGEIAPDFADIPFVEQILLAYEEYLTQQLYFEISASDENYKTYMAEWMQQQGEKRSLLTDSYEIYKKQLDSITMRNGVHKTIAHSIICGGPGTGKTEFLIEYIKETFKKEALVISCRPYMNFEELVGGPELVSVDKSAKLGSLIASLQGEQDPFVVGRVLIKLGNNAVEKMIKNNTSELEPGQLFELRKQFYISLGISERASEEFAQYDNPNSFKTIYREGLDRELAKDTRSKFIEYLLAEQTALVTGQDKVVSHVEGLILAANRFDMAVILDEAEKSLEGAAGSNQSFAGLEHLLTMAPGSTYKLGNIEHTFHKDFYIFLTMNMLTLPPHIRSRFSGREFTFQEQAIDRLKITLAQMSDKDGTANLSGTAQKKLAFLATTAWERLAAAAQEKNIPWNLRTLNTLLSYLVYHNKPTGISFEQASQTLSMLVPEVWGQLEVLHEEAHDSFDDLDGNTTEVTDEDPATDYLLQSTKNIPTPIYPTKGWRRSLSTTEVEKLKVSIDQEKSKTSIDDAKTASLILNGSTIGINLPKQSKNGMKVTLPPELKGQKEIIGCSAWGDKIVVSLKGSDSKNTIAVVSSVFKEKNDQNNEYAKVILAPIEAQTATIHPDGSAVYFYQNNKLTAYSLDSSNEATSQPLLHIDLGNGIPSFEFTGNGRYLVIKQNENSDFPKGCCQVLDTHTSQLYKQPKFITGKPLEGSDWQFSTFKNNLFILNSATNKGYCIN